MALCNPLEMVPRIATLANTTLGEVGVAGPADPLYLALCAGLILWPSADVSGGAELVDGFLYIDAAVPAWRVTAGLLVCGELLRRNGLEDDEPQRTQLAVALGLGGPAGMHAHA